MKRKSTLLLATLLMATLALAEDPAQMFKEAKCMECHNVSDFGGSTSKVKSYKEMHNLVSACQRNNDAGWFDEDSELVSEYLNKKYYHFKK